MASGIDIDGDGYDLTGILWVDQDIDNEGDRISRYFQELH